MRRNTSAGDKELFKVLIAEFRETAAENLDEKEKVLVQRIAESTAAPAIFAPIEDDITAKRLLSLCVEAYFLATNFNNLIAEARQV